MSNRLPPSEYSALCLRVLGRDGYKCRHCRYRGTLGVHHVLFRSEGGPDESWNLVTLCVACHRGVHEEQGLIIDVPDDGFVGPGGGADGVLKFTRIGTWRPH